MIQFGRSIPVAIHPIFWFTAGLIGWINSWTLMGTVIWMIVILISLLVHEYGHALSAKAFGQEAQISLVAMGGLTYHDGKKLKSWQEFMVVLMGPLFGFSLFLLALLIRSLVGASAPAVITYMLTIFVFVNLFWTIVNLLPIMPLDGGQLLRVVLEKFFGHRGLKITLMIGIIVGVALGIGFFIYGLYLVGAILLLLAFQSFASFNQVRTMTSQDRDEDVQKELQEAQEQWRLGHHDAAKERLEAIRKKTQSGLIYESATELLAAIYDRENDLKAVYELLKDRRKKLSLNAKRLLHKAAFKNQDYELTLTIGDHAFRDTQAPEIAYLNARAAAFLKDEKRTIGWLECALNHKFQNIKEALNQPEFDFIKNHPHFQKMMERSQK